MKFRIIEPFDFYDGKNLQKDCVAKNSYWFGSSDYSEYLNAEVYFSDLGKKFAIQIFNQQLNVKHVYLTTNQTNQLGIDETKLKELVNCFHLGLEKDDQGSKIAMYQGHKLELLILESSYKTFFLFYSLLGGRAPECVFFFGLFEVKIK